MCKTRMAVNADEPTPGHRSSRKLRGERQRSRPAQSPRTSSSSAPARSRPPPTFASSSSSSEPSTSTIPSSTYRYSTGATSVSSGTSLSSIRESLPENPHIYDFTEICSATNNFLAKRHGSSTPSWRCTLRGKDVIIFQRKFRNKMESAELRKRLSVICRSHHVSLCKLLGASVSGEHIYLVYEFVHGANLADCLRNSINPSFTVLSTWISRMQIATDLAHALDYIHNSTGLNISFVHNHIKSSSIIVTDPSLNAKICHFGTAQLCGEISEAESTEKASSSKEIAGITEITEAEGEPASKLNEIKRSRSGRTHFEGVMGYMSPEFRSTGVATKMSDVYAFGVVLLELLTGSEPLKYRYDKSKGDIVGTSVIDTARAVIEGGESSSLAGESGGGPEGRLRRWVDKRLKDSFPVEVAAKVTRVALECVHVDPDKRPNMARVAGKISKLYLESRIWSDNMKIPTSISVSFAPR